MKTKVMIYAFGIAMLVATVFVGLARAQGAAKTDGHTEIGSVAQFVGDFLGNSSLDIRGAPMGGGERVRYAWRPAATRT
ncbi:MAG: hypothetical protein ABSE16_11540, partial [Verrucomicrobiota bacterium]